jgi:hypothetical protein
MMANTRFARAVAIVIGGLGLLLAWGCGDDGLPRRYRVYGEVTYNGKPLPRGTVNFIPEGGEGRAASGPIKEGSYDLTTLNPGDGAIPGAYRVTIAAVEGTEESKRIVTRTPGAPDSYDQPYYGPPSGPQIGRANKAAKRLVPAKYNNPETSGLTAKVEERATRVDFTLAD